MAIWADGDGVSARRTKWLTFRPLPVLFLVWAVLIGAAAIQNLAGGQDDARIWILDVDIEQSIYTWFSQLMLAGAAVLLWDTGIKTVAADGRNGMHWMLLGSLFFLLSADEALSLHEKLIVPVRDGLGVSGFLTFAWVIPAIPLCLVGLIALIPFLRTLPTRVRNLMLLSAAMFLGGAVGMELIGGKIYALDAFENTSQAYRQVVTAEEGLEGLGVLVFLSAILLYRRMQGIALGVGSV